MIRGRTQRRAAPPGWRYFASEVLLISFSILLALAVNSWRVASSERASVRDSASALFVELVENKAALQVVDGYYGDVVAALDALIAEVDTDDRPAIDRFGTVEVLRPTVLGLTEPINRVSWDLAKERGDVARMPQELARTLTVVYDGQMPIFSDAVDGVVTLLAEPDMFRPEEATIMLRSLRARFAELAAQQQSVMYRTDNAIAILRDAYDLEIEMDQE